jgi:ABC-type lipoprotein release transport system permease subunit
LFEGIHPSNTQPVTPPILSGHSIEQKDQVVLGAATLAQLGKHIGDTVTVTYGNPQAAPLYVPPTRLVIVGTATLPAVGYSSVIADHTSMGTGVLASVNFLPSSIVQGGNTDPTLNGPDLVFVRLRNGVASAAGLASLQRIATASDRDLAAVPDGGGQGDTVSVVGVQRPAEIVNYRTMGSTPALLASALAGGAILALGLTLAASVRRRRHDLALLKTLGFTQRQLAAAIACQASVAAVIGIVIGVPLGIVLGRWLWTLFARQIYAVPQPTVPVLSVGLVAIGALVLANVVAALPGRSAGRTATAVLLRAE